MTVEYRDPTPNNFPNDYDPSKVDPRVKLRSESIKDKQKGIDVREAIYQGLEIGSVTASEAKDMAKNVNDSTKIILEDAQKSLENSNSILASTKDVVKGAADSLAASKQTIKTATDLVNGTADQFKNINNELKTKVDKLSGEVEALKKQISGNK